MSVSQLVSAVHALSSEERSEFLRMVLESDREAYLEQLEDEEDLRDAQRILASGEPTVSWEEACKTLKWKP